MKNYITQYKVLFCLSWIVLYLVFPAWRFPNNLGDQFIINILLVYFTISAYLMNRYFNLLTLDKPVIITDDCVKHAKNNLWLVLVCCLSIALHIYTSSSINVVGETIFLRQTFWMYDFLNMNWHKLFNFPIQYFFWPLLAVLILLIKQKKAFSYVLNFISANFSVYKSSKLTMPLIIFIMFGLFNAYAYLFPYYSWQESVEVMRFPPVSRFIYLFTYSAFGVSETGPRIAQLIFYILGAVYLYRIILLFHKKDVALLGSTIYLFSPIIFSYASTAALASGTVFFIIIISFYFLRFLKAEDNRDLVLTSYFIGIGFLYKRMIVVMFIICFSYLVLSRIKKRDWNSLIHFKIMLLSLVFILPWLKIGPTIYKAIWSNLITFDELITYAMMIQSQMSLIIFFLLLLSFGFILITKRDHLSLFFGLLFITYYVFFTLMEVGKVNYRYSMTLYPAIVVFLALFIFIITQRIKWKHNFKVFFAVISIYLIFICLVPRSSSNLTTFKYKDFEVQYYPFDKATEWFKDRTDNKEQVASLFMLNYIFYVQKIYADKDEINPNRFRHLGDWVLKSSYPLQYLKEYCYERDISYIMIPYSPKNSLPSTKHFVQRKKMVKYFKDNMDMDSEFEEVARFSLDDNYILIYKLKKSSI